MIRPPLADASGPVVVRARSLFSMADEAPARGEAALFAPLRRTENAALLLRGGRVEAVGSWPLPGLPAGVPVRDPGDVVLIPGCINAHTHLGLSHAAERTVWGRGFSAWMRSLVAFLRDPDAHASMHAAAEEACAFLAACGTAHAGDFTGSLMGHVEASARAAGVGIRHFCEWIGSGPPHADDERPWPPACRQAVADIPGNRLAPAGHALYSTSAEILRDAHAFCRATGRPFAIHLAESPEEDELLLHGGHPLREIYVGVLLPADWKAPGMRPIRHADALGLLTAETLAVHCVRADADDARLLAERGASVCLCPRSNEILVGCLPPARELARSGALPCLGTDGLCSTPDLDVRQDALHLLRHADMPPEALIRMLTVNGAAALRLESRAGRLVPGSPAVFAILPEEMAQQMRA